MTSIWDLIHRERRRLADDLDGLAPEQWRSPSLCGEWDVEEVVAHLTAAAEIGRLAWLRSVIGTRFDFDEHNRRRLEERRGTTPEETLARFRRAVDLTIQPARATWAWLGEVVVHGTDVRRPLGIATAPSPEALLLVVEAYAAKDFAVRSASSVAGLRLEADDADFAHGAGDLVTGPVLSLVMAMAGRPTVLDDLDGPGATVLRDRVGVQP